MPQSPPYLQINNLTKKFGEFVALSDVSLDVTEGEFVCFLGPSGCGKTTLLRAIAGLDIQNFGSVHQAGRDVSSLPPAERDFGIVFQSYALFPNLTIEKNIAYGLESLGKPQVEIHSRVEELLTLIGMPDQGKKHPAQLSGGQQQRVALARALAISPGLLLLDEPLSALDAQVRVKLRHEIKALQHQLGVTTIMVTHDQEEALTMADKIVVINAGVIEQIGTPEEIYNEPATQFVAGFIGAMNFVPAIINGENNIQIGQANFSFEPPWQRSTGKCIAAIRPEDIKVGSEGANTLEAEVMEVEFLGPFVRAELASEALGEHRIQADFSANRVRSEQLSTGSRLIVSLPPQSIRLYTGE
ncbi:MAG: putative 2-aminoethylphosphonate ABC transporter ATP-binding protein [Acidiferrobacterales bacterium]|nr:putative 2-aminoethylphosphonate ABC transporter ATP-binding protein [Acidiferrobacterales bacterium]